MLRTALAILSAAAAVVVSAATFEVVEFNDAACTTPVANASIALGTCIPNPGLGLSLTYQCLHRPQQLCAAWHGYGHVANCSAPAPVARFTTVCGNCIPSATQNRSSPFFGTYETLSDCNATDGTGVYRLNCSDSTCTDCSIRHPQRLGQCGARDTAPHDWWRFAAVVRCPWVFNYSIFDGSTDCSTRPFVRLAASGACEVGYKYRCPV